MLFLLRCVFWLSIVYASILLPKDKWHEVTTEAMRLGTDALQGASHRVAAGALHYCGARASLCVGEAAQLTALIDATGRDDASDAAPRPVAEDLVPTPVPRPRGARDANAARKP